MYHETACIDKGAIIGSGTKVWHWTHICSGAIIGENCTIGQNVFIGDNAIIGNGVKIQNNVSIYDQVVIKDDVFCGPSVVFTNVYNPRAFIPRKDKYQKTVINKGVTIGANSTLICGIEVGEYAFIGAGALVNKSVPDYALIVGVPAEQIGWMSWDGETIDLPIKGKGTFRCYKTNTIYELDGCKLNRTPMT